MKDLKEKGPEGARPKQGNASEGSSSSDHTDKDGIMWGSTEAKQNARSLKDFHDSVIHMAVMQNDSIKLKTLLT
jgi:ankyrin repeat protein